MKKGSRIALLAVLLIAWTAGALWVGRALAEEGSGANVMTTILQKRVSINAQNVMRSELRNAACEILEAAAPRPVGSGKVFGFATLMTVPRGVHPKNERFSLAAENVRAGDMIRAVAALMGGDVYVTGERELALAGPDSAPENRELYHLSELTSLKAGDY